MANRQAQPATDGELHPDRLLTETEVEEIYGIKVSVLRKRRVTGGGIPYLKIGDSVRYRPRNIVAYFDSCMRNSTSDTGETAA